MELRRYLGVLRRRLPLIILTTVVAMALGFASIPRDRSYVAAATILVGPQTFGNGQGSATPSGDQLAGFERIQTTFALLIRTRPVAAAALDKVGLQRSADSVVGATGASVVANTQLVVLTVTDRDPAIARDLTNAVADAFVAKVGELRPGQEGAVPFAPVYVFERAQLPTTPFAASGARNVVIAGIFGFLAAASLAFLLEYLDITVKSAADVEHRLQLPMLGVVPRDRLRLDDGRQPLLTLARQSA